MMIKDKNGRIIYEKGNRSSDKKKQKEAEANEDNTMMAKIILKKAERKK